MSLKRILIVDDEPDIVELLAFTLTAKGYEISRARDGREALQHLKFTIPDLIFLDLEMPEMDGYEVCRHIKTEPRFQKIPIIILTACTLEEHDLQRLAKMKVEGCVRKPFELEEILAHLQKWS